MRSRHVHSGHISPIKTGGAARGIAADRVSLCLLAPERERKGDAPARGNQVFCHWPIVRCSATQYYFYMGRKQIAVALLTASATFAAIAFAIDLGKYAFALWHLGGAP
jgi:hypothetical protein